MAGFVAMVSVMVVVAIEMFFAAKGAAHSHGVDFEFGSLKRDLQGGDTSRRAERRRSGSYRPFRLDPIGVLQEPREQEYEPLQSQRSPYSDTPGSVDKPLPPPPPTVLANDDMRDADTPTKDDDEHSDLDLDELEQETDDTVPLTSTRHPTRKSSIITNGDARPKPPSRSVSFATPISTHISPPPASPLPPQTQEQRLVLQCLLLEAGILFHSVFIGMALSVSTGSAFVVLLIAISFHQTFEGLALGSRIAAIPSFRTDSIKPWAMSLMYGITTPIGQAIGLAVHSLYDPESQFGLLMVGIVNAISAGLLIYAGLVQLLAEDFLSDRSYVDLRGRRRLEASGAVVCGSLLMALVGVWA